MNTTIYTNEITETNPILGVLDTPEALEALYHKNPGIFSSWLPHATEQHPDSETLKVWNARITYLSQTQTNVGKGHERKTLIMIITAFLTCFFVKINVLLDFESFWFHYRFVPMFIIGSMAAYFYFSDQKHRIRISIYGFLMCFIVLASLPDVKNSASITMALLHMPCVLLSLLALTFMGKKWKSAPERIHFLRYLGECLVYTSVILLGGIVLTFLTIGLFSLIRVNIETWYFEYVVVFGLATSPLVATYLYDISTESHGRIAVIIANVFSPLFLVTVMIYLAVIVIKGRTPYLDRDFLITINGLLLLVLSITVYSISGKEDSGKRKTTDLINVGLVSVTLVINVYALSAIVYRWAEYGLTPNRVAVTGTNILICAHLILILKKYMAHIRDRCPTPSLLQTVSAYLPIYSAWSVMMVIGLPLAFTFK